MRAVTIDDADELASIEMKLFPDNCFNERTLAREIELGSGFVITDGWRIVAYVMLRGDRYLVDIMRLGVVPEFQGRGLGTQLLQHSAEQAEHAMLTVHAENKRALQLYSRHGFEIVGRLIGGHWVMGRTRRQQRGHYFIGLDL